MVWCLDCGVRCVASGVWCLGYGVLVVVCVGLWCRVRWCVVVGVWFGGSVGWGVLLCGGGTGCGVV